MSTSHFADFRSALFVTSSLQVLNLVLRFVLSLFLARALGVEGRGELALALTLPIFFHVVLYLGLGEANTYLIGKGRFDAKLIVGSLNSLALLLIILSAVAYFALAGQLISLLKANISQTTYYWAYPIIPLTLVWSHWAANLMGLGLVKKVGLGRVLNTATYLGASVVLVVFLSRHVRGALEGYILGQAVELVFIWRLLKRSVPLGLCWRRDVMKEQLSFGAKNSLGAALNYVNLRADVFFVNWFAGTEGLGIYTVAVGFAELILNIPQILSRVVLSFASEAKDKQGWLLAAHGARLGLLVMGCLVIPMAIFMEPLIHVLYSARFGAAMLPCLVLLPGVVALGFAIILANGLMGYGKVIEWTKAVTFGCAATILLDLLLIPHFGVLGASIASTLAYGTVAWYSLQAFVMSSGLSPRELMLPSKGDLSTYARDLARYWSKLSYRQPK